MKYALIIGHDSKLNGAYGNKGVSEFDFWDSLLQEMVAEGYMPENHECYIMYRGADLNGYSKKMKDLHERMSDTGIRLGIECHFNGYSDPEVNGNEVLYNGANPQSVAYAQLMDECLDDLPNRDRGVKVLTRGDSGFGFVAGSDIPCIIAEPFFGSHQDKFVFGGAYRTLLKKSLQKFLERI